MNKILDLLEFFSNSLFSHKIQKLWYVFVAQQIGGKRERERKTKKKKKAHNLAWPNIFADGLIFLRTLFGNNCKNMNSKKEEERKNNNK